MLVQLTREDYKKKLKLKEIYKINEEFLV